MNDGFMRLVNLVAKFVFALFEVIRIIILFLVVLSVIRRVFERTGIFFIIRIWIFIYTREIVFEKQPISAIFFLIFHHAIIGPHIWNFLNILCAMKI